MSHKPAVLIIDDEEFARENLRILITEFCTEVEVIGTATSAADARQKVEELNPDIIMLDIMMPIEDGFTFLKSIPDRQFQVIFTTAFREHALKAIKENAVDYLEKPIDISELQLAITRAKERVELKTQTNFSADRLTRILKEIALTNNVEKTVIPTKDGIAILRNVDIIHLEASIGYTTLYVTSGKKYVSSKSIKAFEDKLDPEMFFRVHKSHIVNIAHHLRELNKHEGAIAVLSNGAQIPVARRKLHEFMERLNHIE